MTVHGGGCLCGAVRYEVRGQPIRANVCHCIYCQRRTGSAFALAVVFKVDQVDVGGDTATYEHRSDESGRWLRLHFCQRCGTTVTETTEKSPGTIIVQGGTFDDPNWYIVDQQTWARSEQRCVAALPTLKRFERSAVR